MALHVAQNHIFHPGQLQIVRVSAEHSDRNLSVIPQSVSRRNGPVYLANSKGAKSITRAWKIAANHRLAIELTSQR